MNVSLELDTARASAQSRFKFRLLAVTVTAVTYSFVSSVVLGDSQGHLSLQFYVLPALVKVAFHNSDIIRL